MGAIAEMAKAIAYPDEVPDSAVSFVFAVDGYEITAWESAGRVLLEHVLWQKPDEPNESTERLVCELAQHAAGRALREHAVLAWDPKLQAVILWQDAPVSFPAEKLKRMFEVFSVSCDWWRARVEAATKPEEVFPDMVIRP